MPVIHVLLVTSAEEMPQQVLLIKEKMPIYAPRGIIVLLVQVNQRNVLLEHLLIKQVSQMIKLFIPNLLALKMLFAVVFANKNFWD